MKRQFSAGGIIYKQPNLWLVRKPKANPGFNGSLGWSLPKGLVDQGELTEEAALREVREEAGVEAEIVKKLPELKIFFTNNKGEKIFKIITYFVMRWKRDLPEGFGDETERVEWLGKDEAGHLLEFDNEKKLLQAAAEPVEI
jgi:8-oxo-dGTP pyrophosphatase MutT (NUDIX family)